MVGTNSYVAKLKAQLDKAIIQREHWKQLAENRNSILVTEVCPESRSVEEHIIDADSVRASWRLMRGYREQIEALRAENAALRESSQDVRSLVEALEECAASLAWNCLGECRAIHAGPIMPAAMALDTSRAALAAHRQAQSQA